MLKLCRILFIQPLPPPLALFEFCRNHWYSSCRVMAWRGCFWKASNISLAYGMPFVLSILPVEAASSDFLRSRGALLPMRLLNSGVGFAY